MKLSLVIQTPEVEKIVPVAFFSGTLEEKLEKASRLGADGVELISTNPAILDSGAIREKLANLNLQVAAISSGGMAFSAGLTLLNPDGGISAQAEIRLTDLIKFAAELGAPLVTVGSFRGRVSSVKGNGRAILVDILRRAGDTAGSRSIKIALEPLNRYEADLIHNAAEGLDFLREVDHPSIGLLLDTYHVNIEETSWTEPFEAVIQAGKLWHVHIGDNNRLPPGKGMINFVPMVETLRRLNYEGFLSAELLAKPDVDSAAEDTMRFMRLHFTD